MKSIGDICNPRGIPPGTQTRFVALAKFWNQRGMPFLGCSNETNIFFKRPRQLASQIVAGQP